VIRGIVLAAGEGSRIGMPKALLRTSNPADSFLDRACQVLLEGGADAVVAVVSPAVRAKVRISAAAVTLVTNPDPSAGQLSSLQCGLRGLAAVPGHAALVLPVDVPLVTIETVRAVVSHWRATRPLVVRPTRDGRHGHPLLLDASLIPELMRSDLPDGARTVVRAHRSDAGELPIDDDGAYLDVDTADDYFGIFGRLPEGVSVR